MHANIGYISKSGFAYEFFNILTPCFNLRSIFFGKADMGLLFLYRFYFVFVSVWPSHLFTLAIIPWSQAPSKSPRNSRAFSVWMSKGDTVKRGGKKKTWISAQMFVSEVRMRFNVSLTHTHMCPHEAQGEDISRLLWRCIAEQWPHLEAGWEDTPDLKRRPSHTLLGKWFVWLTCMNSVSSFSFKSVTFVNSFATYFWCFLFSPCLPASIAMKEQLLVCLWVQLWDKCMYTTGGSFVNISAVSSPLMNLSHIYLVIYLLENNNMTPPLSSA